MFVEKAVEVAKALDPAFNQSPFPAAHVRSGSKFSIQMKSHSLSSFIGFKPSQVRHQVIATLMVVEFCRKLVPSTWSTTTWPMLQMISTGLIERLEFETF